MLVNVLNQITVTRNKESGPNFKLLNQVLSAADCLNISPRLELDKKDTIIIAQSLLDAVSKVLPRRRSKTKKIIAQTNSVKVECEGLETGKRISLCSTKSKNPIMAIDIGVYFDPELPKAGEEFSIDAIYIFPRENPRRAGVQIHRDPEDIGYFSPDGFTQH